MDRGFGSSEDFRIAFDGVLLTLGKRRVFRGLSCGFRRGEITVVLGGSGAGKSTLLRLIGGLLRADAGSVRVAGQDNMLQEDFEGEEEDEGFLE